MQSISLKNKIFLILVLLFFVIGASAGSKNKATNFCNNTKNATTFILGSSYNTTCPTSHTIQFKQSGKWVSYSGVRSWDYSGDFSAAYQVSSNGDKHAKLSHLYSGFKTYSRNKSKVTVPLGKSGKVRIKAIDYGQATQIYIKIICWQHN